MSRRTAVARDFDNTLYRIRQKGDILNDPLQGMQHIQQQQHSSGDNRHRYVPYLKRSPAPADSSYDARWNQRFDGFQQASNMVQHQQFNSSSIQNNSSPPALYPSVHNGNLNPASHDNKSGFHANTSTSYQPSINEKDQLFVIRQQSKQLEEEKTKRLLRLDLALRHQESLSVGVTQQFPPPLVLPTNDLSMASAPANQTLSPDSGLGSIGGDVSDHVYDENNNNADTSPSTTELNFKFTESMTSTATNSPEAALLHSSETPITTTTTTTSELEVKKTSLVKPRRWLNTKMSSWKSRMASEEKKDGNIVSPVARKSFDFGNDSMSTVSSPGSLIIDEDVDI